MTTVQRDEYTVVMVLWAVVTAVTVERVLVATGPQRSEMMTMVVMVTVDWGGWYMTVVVVGSSVRESFVSTSVTVTGVPDTVASGKPLVRDTSVSTLVTVAGVPEMVASGRPLVKDTSVWTSVRVEGFPETVTSGGPWV
jgi:hypothetical protein